MSNQTLSALSKKYFAVVRKENCGLLRDGESSDVMTDYLIEAGIEWEDFIAYLEDEGII